ESGKSHLLSAIAKVISGKAVMNSKTDLYEIKDICRYCGFDGLDDGVWPEIGLELRVAPEEAALFSANDAGKGSPGNPAGQVPSTDSHIVTVIVNGAKDATFATVYIDNVLTRQLSKP